MSICLALSDADWSLTKDVFSVLSTFVSAAAVGVAWFFGSAGLSTWRRQLRGSADHELARRALMELYTFRDVVQKARMMGIFSVEAAPFDGETDTGNPSIDHFNGEVRAYKRRFQAMENARNPLKATLIEAEALWGKELAELMEPLFKLEREFVDFASLYLRWRNPQEDNNGREAMSGLLSARRDVLYERHDGEDDFSAEMQIFLVSVETFLKSKLIPT